MISLSDGMYSMNEEVLISSLKILSELLYKHYGKKTILLIDEYDVPLDKISERILQRNDNIDPRNVWRGT